MLDEETDSEYVKNTHLNINLLLDYQNVEMAQMVEPIVMFITCLFPCFLFLCLYSQRVLQFSSLSTFIPFNCVKNGFACACMGNIPFVQQESLNWFSTMTILTLHILHELDSYSSQE